MLIIGAGFSCMIHLIRVTKTIEIDFTHDYYVIIGNKLDCKDGTSVTDKIEAEKLNIIYNTNYLKTDLERLL